MKMNKSPSIKRLPFYLHELRVLANDGKKSVSTTYLSNLLEIEAIVIRKDLEMTGAKGEPRVGYNVLKLIERIQKFLGWASSYDAYLIGAGSLGTALLGYEGFTDYGLNIRAAFDIDPKKVDHIIHNKPVYDIQSLKESIEESGIKLAILCVPTSVAQVVTDIIISAGITAIWNYSYCTLQVPDYVVVQRVNLAGNFALLSMRMAEGKGATKSSVSARKNQNTTDPTSSDIIESKA